MTILELIEQGAARLTEAQVAFGHGTTNAFDEAAWLTLWRLNMPLDALGDVAQQSVAPDQAGQVQALIEQRITTRKPAAYLTQEAWLQGVSFYVDERVIVPRSFIAEVLADGSIDHYLLPFIAILILIVASPAIKAVIKARFFSKTSGTPPESLD